MIDVIVFTDANKAGQLTTQNVVALNRSNVSKIGEQVTKIKNNKVNNQGTITKLTLSTPKVLRAFQTEQDYNSQGKIIKLTL